MWRLTPGPFYIRKAEKDDGCDTAPPPPPRRESPGLRLLPPSRPVMLQATRCGCLGPGSAVLGRDGNLGDRPLLSQHCLCYPPRPDSGVSSPRGSAHCGRNSTPWKRRTRGGGIPPSPGGTSRAGRFLRQIAFLRYDLNGHTCTYMHAISHACNWCATVFIMN